MSHRLKYATIFCSVLNGLRLKSNELTLSFYFFFINLIFSVFSLSLSAFDLLSIFPFFASLMATECLREHIKSMARLFIIFFCLSLERQKQQPKKKRELIETFSCNDKSTPKLPFNVPKHRQRKKPQHEKSN